MIEACTDGWEWYECLNIFGALYLIPVLIICIVIYNITQGDNFMRSLFVFIIGVIALFCLYAGTAPAQEAPAAGVQVAAWDRVRVSWDHNEPRPEGYRVYMAAPGENFDFTAPVCDTVENFCDITGLPADVDRAVIVRAYQGDYTSQNSDRIVFNTGILAKDIVYPNQPGGVKVTITVETN